MTKFIALYKCVSSPEEFYSEVRNTIDYPAQVMHRSKNYILVSTMILSSSKQEKRLISSAKEKNIDCYVKLGQCT
jgi:hypothetical protein